MTQAISRDGEGIFAGVVHIQEDLHELRGQVAELAAAVARIGQVLDELAPAARRAAAMFDSPVTAYLAARKEASDAERVQRAAESPAGGRRARLARRKLPHA